MAPYIGKGDLKPVKRQHMTSAYWLTMGKKLIQPDGADPGSAITKNKPETKVIDLSQKLVKLEAAAEKAFGLLHKAGWRWAVAITKIHDAKCYPGVDQPDGWAAYMKVRWNIERAQAYNYVSWVHHEVKLVVVPVEQALLEDRKSTKVDSTVQEPPETPTHKTESQSRRHRRSSGTRGTRSKHGKLGEEDTDKLLENGSIAQGEDGQFYGKNTAQGKAILGKRLLKPLSGNGVAVEANGEETTDPFELKKRAMAIIELAQKKADDKHQSLFWFDDLGYVVSERSLEQLVAYMKGTLSRDEFLAVKPAAEPAQPVVEPAVIEPDQPVAEPDQQSDENIESELKEILVRAFKYYGQERTAIIVREVLKEYQQQQIDSKKVAAVA